MLIECIVILGLIVVVALMYIRTKKKDYALATVPLTILPLANVLAYTCSGVLSNLFPMDKFTVYAALNIVAVIISSCFVGIMSGKFKKRTIRASYITISLIFNIALAAILVYNMFEMLYR
ncbi:MAG: hypothetical protein J6C96_06380 [Oscillospiraceae bacterium]|nr:hypothetical protein [Oscillospiraceae bacterium]